MQKQSRIKAAKNHKTILHQSIQIPIKKAISS